MELAAKKMIRELTFDDAKVYENARNKVAFCAGSLIMLLEDDDNMEVMTEAMEKRLCDILGYDPKEEEVESYALEEDRAANDYIQSQGIILDDSETDW